MSKALMVLKQGDWQLIQNIAPVAAASRMFGVTEQQASIVMLKGHELGLGLAASFEFIHVIEGKPSVSPKGALALIHQSGELAELSIDDCMKDDCTPDRCIVRMKRRNGFEYITSYSMDDAKRAGVVKAGSGWEKYPANMLRWRAVGYCADVVFPDVIGGMLRLEELGAVVDEQGEPWVETTVTHDYAVEPAKPVVGPSIEPSSEAMATIMVGDEMLEVKRAVPSVIRFPTIDALIAAGWTAEQILVANEGIIPGTAEDCQRVAEKLEAEA